MDFGKSLRDARDAKGYTISQIAEMTHIKPSVIEGLEKEDFSAIAAPIYGRGFVKLYCEAVGLEAKPLVDEFMAIINGEHEIQIRERPVVATEEPAPAPAVTPPPSPQKPVVERDLFTQDEPVAAEPPPARAPIPAPEAIPAAEPISAPEQSPAAEPKARLSRYAPSFHSEDRAPAALPGLPWRLIILGVAGLAILLILVFGIRALYRATTAEPVAETKPKAETASAAPATQSGTKSTARTQQQNIPSLYID